MSTLYLSSPVSTLNLPFYSPSLIMRILHKPKHFLVMVTNLVRALITTSALFSAANAHSRRRCVFGDDCWPDDCTWQAFNASVSGRLLQSVPSAAVCHQERFDAGLCDAARKGWKDSFWRTNQTGAYSAILWELGDDQYFIASPPDAPCDSSLDELFPRFEISLS